MIQARLLGVFERLAAWPVVIGAKPMKGNRKGQYRFRTGDCRVLFAVDVATKTITVQKIGDRRDVYEE